MKCALKNVKVHPDLSEETTCFSANLYIEGKKAASVNNTGRGGANRYHFNDHALEAAFRAYCLSLPPLPAHDEWPELPMDADLFVNQMVHDFDELRSLKRWCKKETLFRLKGDKVGTWRTIRAKFDAHIKAHLVKTYGEQIERVANEEVGHRETV